MDNIILELNGRHLLGIVLLLAFLFVPIGISLLPYKGDTSKLPLFDRLQNRMGLGSINSGLLFVAIALWALIFVSLALGLLGVVWTFILSPIPQGQAQVWDWRFSLAKMAALTATLGAVVALPFTLIRLAFARTQTETAVEALFNDKINAAVEDLHAQRQISLAVTDDEIQTHETIWQDDVTRRNGAIDRLEGLVQENPASAERVARMVSVYVRELSQEFKPVPTPETADPETLRDWAGKLEPARSDMQNAVQVLGRLQRISGVVKLAGLINLSGANLQGFDLSRLSFNSANFSGTSSQGANFRRSHLQKVVFRNGKLQGSHLSGTNLEKINLEGAQLQGANLIGAQLQGADLSNAVLHSAMLRLANLQGADLTRAQLQGAVLLQTKLQGATLRIAQLQGAILYGAQLQGTQLSRLRYDNSITFSEVNLRGASLHEIELTETTLENIHLELTYGDASVSFPGSRGLDHPSWPDHWSKETLKWPEFKAQWRAFQASIGQDPDNPA